MIPDDYQLYVDELRRAAEEVDLVVATGGLGPTSDDLTREVFAEVADRPLEYHDELWEQLKARFPRRKISETNKKQVMIPAGFTVFDNANGTAPAFAGAGANSWLIALPGPPRELTPIVEEQVRPFLAGRFAVVPEEVLRATALMVPESELEEAIQRHADPGNSADHAELTALTWGTRAELYRISFVLRGSTAAHRDEVFRALQRELGSSRIHAGDTSAAELLLHSLGKAGRMLATAESCTGGLIGALITDLPGSSAVFWGGVTAYSNATKERVLGVSPELLKQYGAVSEETAKAMAEGILGLAKHGGGLESESETAADTEAGTGLSRGTGARPGSVDLGVAVTGVAGPDGGTREKPVGTVWIAVAKRDGATVTKLLSLPASRDRVRRWSAISAMLLAYEVMEQG